MKKAVLCFCIMLALLVPLVVAKEQITIQMNQVQIQCRRWDPPGWRYWYWNYPIDWEFEHSGNVLHTEISYQPGVLDEEGTSMVYVYDKKVDKWILHEGTIKYHSPYSGLWITEYWRGYLELDGNGDFVHGVGYQWGYHYGSDPRGYYTYAIWDDTMGAWLLGFSIYIWDDTSVDQEALYFTGGMPNIPYQHIEPVPASNYNPFGL